MSSVARHLDPVFALNGFEAAFARLDAETQTHSVGVAVLSVELGVHHNYDHEQLRVAALAGLGHDLGKCALFVPSRVLTKEGVYTVEDARLSRAHAIGSFLTLHWLEAHDPEHEFLSAKNWERAKYIGLTNHCHKRADGYPTVEDVGCLVDTGLLRLNDFHRAQQDPMSERNALADMFEVFEIHDRSYLEGRMAAQGSNFIGLLSEDEWVKAKAIRELIEGEMQMNEWLCHDLDTLLAGYTRLANHPYLRGRQLQDDGEIVLSYEEQATTTP